MPIITATYEVTCPPDAIERVARELAIEQTVEVPEELLADPEIQERIVGKVATIQPVEGTKNRFIVTNELNTDLACEQLPQFLNLIYGNLSIKNFVRLIDLTLPEEFLRHFRGPNYGIRGLRAIVGVHERPLVSTALKPRGSSIEHFATIAREFALGGGDIVKDDHNLVDASFEDFKRRVSLCQKAVEEANKQTGRRCLYFPYLCAPAEHLERFVEFSMYEGVFGFLISPMLVGLDVMRSLAQKYPIVMMTHPTMTGTFYNDKHHGIEPGLLLGTIFRIAGADISVYTNLGGRFNLTRDECAGIAQRLRAPLGNLESALPAPAGGMKFENIPEMAGLYGSDTIFLVGGALLAHSSNLRESTAVLLRRIKEFFPERLTEPQSDFASTYDAFNPRGQGKIVEHLPFISNFTWEGRAPSEYKTSGRLPFKDVTRHELIGKFGENDSFDLRYFEIAPGGYSSREKHLHTHAIICARGRGILSIGERRYELKAFDIARIPSMAVHQFLNESHDEPFGFFCIVDHDRDRPMAP